MWWVHPSGAYYADGYMGQKVVVIPDRQIVIVNLVFTGTPSFKYLSPEIKKELSHLVKRVSNLEFRRLVELILDAGPKRDQNNRKSN
jgi:CubicO group peptidase (beta-lactamase class C family)